MGRWHDTDTKVPYVFIDFETTGLDAKTEQVIEIGAIKIGADGSYSDFHTFVKLDEGRVLSDFIKNYTGITEDDLANGVSEEKALRALWDFIYTGNNGLEPVVVAHHAPFDFSFLAKYRLYPREFICTRVLAKQAEPNEKAGLADVTKRHNIPLVGHHRALNDVAPLIEILKKLVPIAESNGKLYRNYIINDVERPLSFIPAYATVDVR